MKRLSFLVILLLCSLLALPIASAQTLADTTGQARVASEILTTLKQVEAFQQLFIRRNVLEVQLKDINQWRSEGKLSGQKLTDLQASFTRIQAHTNQFADLLCRDLRSFRRLRDIQKNKLNPMVQNLTGSYRTPLLAAGREYDETFAPLYKAAAAGQVSDYKFVPLLPLLLEAAPIIVTTLIDLVQGRRATVADQLMQLGVSLAVTQLQQKLALKDWSAYVGGGAPSMPVALAQANVGNAYRFLDGSVEMTSTNTGQSISLTTRFQAVGSEQLPYFETTEGLPINHKFRVKVTGSEYVAILSYDTENNRWKQNYPIKDVTKSIGEQEDLQGKALILPSATRSFVIEPGENQHDSFLILVSNMPINEDALNLIVGQTVMGSTILTKVNEVFSHGHVKASWSEAVPGQRVSKVPLKASSASTLVSPIFVDIRKK